MGDKTTPGDVWKPPFRYDKRGSWITDANGVRVLDLRGWGYLTGRGGALGLDYDVASAIQDQLGVWLASVLCEQWPERWTPVFGSAADVTEDPWKGDDDDADHEALLTKSIRLTAEWRRLHREAPYNWLSHDRADILEHLDAMNAAFKALLGGDDATR